MTVIQRVVEYGINHPEQVAALLGALLSGAEHYRRTGSVPLGRLPLKHLRHIVRQVGNEYFEYKRPTKVPALLVDADPAEIEAKLRDDHYESVDLFSYEYTGEVVNIRRPEGMANHPKTGEAVPMENHMRAFRTSNGKSLVLDHLEASRFEAWSAHYRGEAMSWGEGREIAEEDLKDAQFDVKLIESEDASDVEVVSAPENSSPGVVGLVGKLLKR